MKARKGSTHGYDIVDHTRINPELGGDAGFERLSNTLREHGLGLILDFVPNHVGVHFADNPWWLDMLDGDPPRPMPHHSTSIGTNCRIAPAAASCCRSSDRRMGRRWKKVKSSSATMWQAAAFRPGISRTACRSGP